MSNMCATLSDVKYMSLLGTYRWPIESTANQKLFFSVYLFRVFVTTVYYNKNKKL